MGDFLAASGTKSGPSWRPRGQKQPSCLLLGRMGHGWPCFLVAWPFTTACEEARADSEDQRPGGDPGTAGWGRGLAWPPCHVREDRILVCCLQVRLSTNPGLASHCQQTVPPHCPYLQNRDSDTHLRGLLYALRTQSMHKRC